MVAAQRGVSRTGLRLLRQSWRQPPRLRPDVLEGFADLSCISAKRAGDLAALPREVASTEAALAMRSRWYARAPSGSGKF